MTIQEIKRKVSAALKDLYTKDIYLIDKNVHERSLTFRLGMYLQRKFKQWDVDCEYNKNCQAIQGNKFVLVRCNNDTKGDCSNCTNRKNCTVFPDIIIHQRGSDQNLLVIEAKCNASVSQIAEDKEKLQAYLDESTLHYQHGLFINFQETLEKTKKDLYWFPDNYDCEGRKNIGNEEE